MSDRVKVLLILGVAVVLVSIGEALTAKALKQATEQMPQDSSSFSGILGAVLGDWRFVLGVALFLCYLGLYITALGMAELSYALPLSAASYLLGIFWSKYYLGEEIKPARWIGTAIIIAGVLVVGFAGWGGSDKNSNEGGNNSSEQQSTPSSPEGEATGGGQS